MSTGLARAVAKRFVPCTSPGLRGINQIYRASATVSRHYAVPARSPGRRERLIILGTGWGGYSVLRKVDKRKFDVIVISPRNHFLFTPLLASTTVGTLEFRSIIEPVRYMYNNSNYLQPKREQFHGIYNALTEYKGEGIFLHTRIISSIHSLTDSRISVGDPLFQMLYNNT